MWWAPRKGGHSEICGGLFFVRVEGFPPNCWSPSVKLAVESSSPRCPSYSPPCCYPHYGEANGSTPPSDAV